MTRPSKRTQANKRVRPCGRFRFVHVSILVAAFALIATLQAWATPDMTLLGAKELQTIFTELATSNSALQEEDIEISHFSATPETITLPPGIQRIQVVSQNRPKQLGRQTIVVDILVDDTAQERVTLSGNIELYGSVVCATKTLSRRSIITDSDVEQVRRNLSMLGPDLVDDTEKVVGMELKTTVQPGAVLYGRFLKSPVTVKRGDIVTIQAASGTLTISVPGRVKTAGATGDLIKVKNLMSRREIYARVLGPDTVQVEL